jgi:16S rRNA (adenine1518-N6/adenine1519-N6)-dimethyltransferase
MDLKDIKTQELVKKYNFKFTKSLGQNFLIDDSVLSDIVDGAEVNGEDFVIEIGPGVGTLTAQLLMKAKKVAAIELDSDLIPILETELGENEKFNLIHKDALKVDFNELIGDEKSVKLVANLPYYVTTPIILKLLKDGYNFKSLTIMIQKEVAERINSEPNCKEYGALSVLVQYYCDTSILRVVAPTSFIPRPKVESIVIKLDKLDKPRVETKDVKFMFELVRAGFNMRRKTLWNATKTLKVDKEKLQEAFKKSGIDPKRRAETLTVQEFAKLADCIYDVKAQISLDNN